MKKRIACLFLILATLLSACGLKKGDPVQLPDAQPAYDQEAPLLAAVESQEEAEELAELYGITLLSVDYGIATFYTEEDPYEVIQRGEKNGWTPLDINEIQTAN